MDIISLIALALAPGCAIILYIYLKDKHEREPFLLLLMSFVYGGVSVLLTLAISWLVNLLMITRADDYTSQFINAFFKVALVEEFSKFAFVRFVLFNNKNFNEPFDGIVYAVMVSMGFATLENFIYVFQYGFMTGVLRMFTAVPAHATFGILMGYYLGRAKFIHTNTLFYSIIALLIATLFHGAYDYFWFIAEIKDVYTGIWIASLLSLIIGFVLSRKAIRIHLQASPFINNNEGQSSTPFS